MQVTVKANFNKQSKDSKKELIQFYVKGADENKQELNQLCREVVELEIEGVGQKLTCEFSKTSKDANKTVLDFIVKGDTSADKSYEFYRKAGSDVTLSIVESQMSIDEFHEGIDYSVDGTGNVDVDEDQLVLEGLDDDNDDDLLN